MPKFRNYIVYVPEVYMVPHVVEATSEKEALSLAFHGEGHATGGEMYYRKTLDDFNMYEVNHDVPYNDEPLVDIDNLPED